MTSDDVAQYREWYRLMSLERALSLGVAERNRQPGMFRPATTPAGPGGSEAIPIGVVSALRRIANGDPVPDIVVNTLAGQHYIALGLDPALLMAESYGKASGYNRGHAGHLRSLLELGAYGHQGNIGADFTAAVGLALGAKWNDQQQIVVCGFGDGASNAGKFHEAANFAAVHRLPLLFVAVNNHFATSVPVWETTALGTIAQRAQAYGFPGRGLEGNDVVEVYEAAREAVAYVRDGNGPMLLEFRTVRLTRGARLWAPDLADHIDDAYWRGRDPLALLRQRGLAAGALTVAEFEALDVAAGGEAKRVFAFVDASPDPDPAELATDGPVPLPPAVTARFAALEPPAEAPLLSYGEAIRGALWEALSADRRVFVMGLDIRSSLHNDTTLGLVDEFGPGRIIDTPISEATTAGAAIGTALQGYRPVIELGLMSYVTPAIEEIASVMANLRYISAGRYRLPIVIRTNLAGGGGATYGATNTQSWQAWFVHVPNLTICMPSTAYDARGLLATAIDDDNPVLFIEHRNLYAQAGPVPAGSYRLPYGQAVLRRRGSDVTVVAFGILVPMALEAAAALAGRIEADVIDPRTLQPFDYDTVIASLEKTGGRLVVCDNGYRTGGLAAWLVGELAIRRPGLVRRVEVVTAPDSTVPYAASLARAFFPDAERVRAAIVRVAADGAGGDAAVGEAAAERGGDDG